MEVGEWVGPGLTQNFFVENHPKIALNQYYTDICLLYIVISC